MRVTLPEEVRMRGDDRQRARSGAIPRGFLGRALARARAQRPVGDGHFRVEGPLIGAGAGWKSLKKPGEPRTPPEDPGNPTVNFHGERRSNATHASTTDPEARLIRKGHQHEAKLGYLGHARMDNRQGLVVQACVTPATGTAEWEAALAMVDRVPAGATLGADRGSDTRAFVAPVRARGLTPHVAQNTSRRRRAIDGRTTRHAGYWLSQRRRKRV